MQVKKVKKKHDWGKQDARQMDSLFLQYVTQDLFNEQLKINLKVIEKFKNA